ncbi:hypothetical protein [Nocardiopsis sp. FIRDI 009]|uniref:hypothetical protein n=1 Tax=Nocardiopsis sp. FIRDI 009 TaxID=714197 RepID=UPI000E24B2DA|nr:hypothetical protein [Nocardiopsis sp. FIRDI 009]
MNTALWQLELLRTRRTPGFAITAALMVLLGAGSPFMALHADAIIAAMDPMGAAPAAPEATPRIAVTTFMDNTVGPLLVATVLVAATALAFDGRPSRALFLRTRVRRAGDLVVPRWAVASAAVSVAYTVGALGAWSSTTLVLGPLPLGEYLLGTALVCGYLTFVVAVVALAAGLVRNVLAVLGVAIGFLVAVAVAAQIPALAQWTPQALLGAQAVLPGSGTLADFVPGLVTTLVLDVACVVGSAWLCSRREV